MYLAKHIRNLTEKELKNILRNRTPIVLGNTYRVEGIGGYPGRLSVPEQCWHAATPEGPWTWTEIPKPIEEFVQTGNAEVYYVTQDQNDGTVSFIHFILTEDLS